MSNFPSTARCANLVFYRSYSRLFEGKKETFSQMCDRAISGLSKTGKLTKSETELIDRMQRDLITTVSGRWMWVGGSKWLENAENTPGGYNCFQADTLVNTLEYGAKRISELSGKQVHVVNKNRDWSLVEFKDYGVQEIYQIELHRRNASGKHSSVLTTSGHRWILESGETVTTNMLREGDRIPFVTASRKPIKDDNAYILGVRHGIIYGDGSSSGNSTSGRNNFKVRLRGQKAELLFYFNDCNTGHCLSSKGDTTAFVSGKDFAEHVSSGNLKELPETNNIEYLAGFFRGLLATNGNVSRRPRGIDINIFGKIETIEWIEKLLPRLGIEVASKRLVYAAGSFSNLGMRKTSTYQISFFRPSIEPEDLLQTKHLNIFKGFTATRSNSWRVSSVQKTVLNEVVYCCEEPVTGTFVLAGGLLTGNCSSQEITSIESIVSMMELAMCGVGTGAVLTQECISQLPEVTRKLEIEIKGNFGDVQKESRNEDTKIRIRNNSERKNFPVVVQVGDSRQGWVKACEVILSLAMGNFSTNSDPVYVSVDISNVRPAGEKLKGFGGESNPSLLPELFVRMASILNKAYGRQLTSIEISLLIDEASLVVVVGNVRRSAGIRQFDHNDVNAVGAKDNLWAKGDDGSWSVDPDRAALRMANHTLVYHHKPSFDELLSAVTKQYYSGEGAIQWAGEAVARCSADILKGDIKKDFLAAYGQSKDEAKEFLLDLGADEVDDRLKRFAGNPCFEIFGHNFFCNLSAIHANRLDPLDFGQQVDAFNSGAIIVASLLHDRFEDPRFQKSREIDPIVGVSITGLFDFFVNLFGVEWLKWWEAGRPEYWKMDTSQAQRIIDKVYDAAIKFNVNLGNQVWMYSSDLGIVFAQIEQFYLSLWRQTVEKRIGEYCHKHGLKVPNRTTTIQPHGSVALLTNACPGWHPPKGAYVIRRITYSKSHPIALAAMDKGYSVIPGQQDKDENGTLLNDPFDPRVTEWLIEVPIKTDWADLKGVSAINIGAFSIQAQYSFYMQVQKYYTTHNTSATLEITEAEIPILAGLIYESIQKDEGYASAAILARFESLETFPRMPFEPITRQKYEQLCKEVDDRDCQCSFDSLLVKYGLAEEEAPAGCDSGKCMLTEVR